MPSALSPLPISLPPPDSPLTVLKSLTKEKAFDTMELIGGDVKDSKEKTYISTAY
jgi:hypothetical protein